MFFSKHKNLLTTVADPRINDPSTAYKGFEFTPIMRYVGKRYGNVEHKEKISSHTVMDLKFSYIKEKNKLCDELKISLEFDNIFNNKHISTIEAMDSNVSGTTYYVGAPFTVKGSISLLF